jgi:hypothetical protein
MLSFECNELPYYDQRCTELCSVQRKSVLSFSIIIAGVPHDYYQYYVLQNRTVLMVVSSAAAAQ